MSRHRLPPGAVEDMVVRRLDGQTLLEIADVWNTTTEHVRQTLNRYWRQHPPVKGEEAA